MISAWWLIPAIIIINNIEAYGDLYQRLYSDHVPVVADLTLL